MSQAPILQGGPQPLLLPIPVHVHTTCVPQLDSRRRPQLVNAQAPPGRRLQPTGAPLLPDQHPPPCGKTGALLLCWRRQGIFPLAQLGAQRVFFLRPKASAAQAFSQDWFCWLIDQWFFRQLRCGCILSWRRYRSGVDYQHGLGLGKR